MEWKHGARQLSTAQCIFLITRNWWIKMISQCKPVLIAGVLLAVLLACTLPVRVPAPDNLPAPLQNVLQPSPTPEFTPTPAPTPIPTLRIVCPTGNCASACIDKLNSFLQSSGKPGSPPRSTFGHQGSQDQQTVMVTYDVKGDVISSPQLAVSLPAALVPYQEDAVTQAKIWDYFITMIPPDRRQEINHYIVFTDGVGGVLASVGEISNDMKHWVLSVDILDAQNPRELTYTLVHEFGHLLTLNSDQVTPDPQLLSNPDNLQVYQQEAASCPQFMANNGCTGPDSYMNLFFQKFWPKIYPQWEKINAEKDQRNYLALLGQFYWTYPGQFVTQYAVTSPEEDIAETWARFVLGSEPSGKDIATQKVLFFYGFPELVDLRERIANGICNYAEAK